MSVWRLTAWIAGTFSLLIALAMVAGHIKTRVETPLTSPQLKKQREALRLSPKDEAAKQRIRDLDLRLRQTYFRQIARMNSGVYLLLGGVAVMVLAVRQERRGRKQLPVLLPKPNGGEAAPRAAALARWSVAATGAGVGVLLFGLSLGWSVAVPRREAEVDKLLGGGAQTAEAAPDAATPEEYARQWPRFRGPRGDGVSPFTNAPVAWDAASGAGIAWKVPAPAAAFNSPILWGDRVFFSGGDAARREVFCLDAKTGATLWRQAIENVPGTPNPPPEVPESTGYAASTMATDGRRVYAIFANGDLAALTLEGRVVWSKGFGALNTAYGHSSSLATWRDRVIVQLDQGEAEAGKSKLYALDGRTGQVVWQKPRRVGASWASPIVFEAAGKAQIVALAVPQAMSYAAADGTELWRADCLNGEIAPSAIFAGGLVIVPSPAEKLTALRPDGQGDVSKTHVAWTAEDNVPDVSSPAGNGEFVFAITTGGTLTCFDARDGKKQWEHEMNGEFHASPTIAGNRVYLFSQKGDAVVVEAAREFKELLRTPMPDVFHASPAFGPDRIIVRGMTNIWCLGISGDKVAGR